MFVCQQQAEMPVLLHRNIRLLAKVHSVRPEPVEGRAQEVFTALRQAQGERNDGSKTTYARGLLFFKSSQECQILI